MSGVASQIPDWLASAGLERYSSLFEDVSEEGFLSLQMTDYEKYGLTNIDDKQRLFRLIKRLGKTQRTTRVADTAPSTAPTTEMRRGWGASEHGLLDLDENDGDLLDEAQGDTFLEPPLRPTITPAIRGPPPPKIRVVVRKRPINKKEKERGEDDIMNVDMAKGELMVNEPKLRVDLTRYIERHRFVFDDALAEGVSNDDVYRSTVQPLVQTLFWGGKATCFAYGQTGSGKTYTMTPLPLKAADEIFSILNGNREFKNFYLYVSCFEIYGGKIFDLLNARKKLEIREDSKRRVVVVGLKEFAADSLSFIQTLIHRASSTRSTGTTGANTDSSRSHSIMQFAIKKGNKAGVSLVGKISFIDLAGSERGADTCDNNRQTRLEGAEINKSLLALKECIRALDCEARHVPFRGSKLTAVLRDSFVGKEARTVMIANVSPNSLSVEHSLNTLRYADRVKELRKEKNERSTSLVTPGRLLPAGYSNTTIEEEQETGLDPYIDPASQKEVKVAQPPPTSRGNKRNGPASLSDSLSFHGRNKSTPSLPEEPFEDIRVDRSHRPTQSCITYSSKEETSEMEEECEIPESVVPERSVAPMPSVTNREELLAQHEVVMNDILDGEEVVIEGHRRMIESLMELVKEEMSMLSEVDQPGSAIDKYIGRLDKILTEKCRIITAMQRKVDEFKAKLGQEEELSQVLGGLR